MSSISSDVLAVGRVKPDNISSSFLFRLFGATFWLLLYAQCKCLLYIYIRDNELAAIEDLL